MGKCAINPNSGFGHYPEKMPTPKGSRKVLIVGGGVAGLQAALTATERGHQVTLVEKSDRLGGTINFTDTDQDKVDLRNFKNLLIREVEKNNHIEVRLHLEVTPDWIEAFQADEVILAIGAKPMVPKIPGIEMALNALEAYNNILQIGQKVVLVGGGLVGCEVGLHLANEGKDITIIEMNTMMAYETFGYYRNALLDEMDKRHIQQILGAKCLEFQKNGIVVLKDEKETFIPADTVIYSMGMVPKSDLVETLSKGSKVGHTHVIGDCLKAGKLGDAVRNGYIAAMSII